MKWLKCPKCGNTKIRKRGDIIICDNCKIVFVIC